MRGESGERKGAGRGRGRESAACCLRPRLRARKDYTPTHARTHARRPQPPNPPSSTTTTNNKSAAPEKPEKEITAEIQAIVRQITASVTFLPLLEDACELGLVVVVV